MNLLLDIDGVLQFGRPDFVQHLGRLGWVGDYEEFQAAIFADEQYLATLIGQGDIRSVLNRLLTRFGQTLTVDQLMHEWSGANLTFNEELLGVLPMLDCHSTRLASNQDPVRGQAMRELYGARAGIDHIYLSCDIGLRKPDVDYFEHILRELDCRPEEVVFVDDSLPNVHCAQAIGIHAIAYETNATLFEQLKTLGIMQR